MSNRISLMAAQLAVLALAVLAGCTPATAAPGTEPVASGTPNVSPSASPVNTLEPPPTAKPSPTPSETPTPSATPTPILTATPSPTSTPDPTAEAKRLYEEAVALYEAGDFEAALESINQSLTYNPDSPEALRTRSTLWLWGAGDVDSAIADLERAISLEPGEAQNYMLLAGAYYAAKQNDEARVALDAALEQGLADEDYYNLRALIRSRDDADLEGAESDARMAVTASGSSLDTVDTLAFVFIRSGQLEASLELYELLEEELDDFYYSRLGKGLALWQLGETEEAIPLLKSGLVLLKAEPTFDALIKLEPQTLTLAFGAVTRIGDPAIEESLELVNGDDVEGALEYLEEMRGWAIGDHLYFANSTSGELYAELGRHEEAVDVLTQAIEYKPTGFLYLSRARSYHKIGQFAEALADIEHRHELAAPNVNSLRLSSVIRRDMGDYQGALADIEAAVALDPNDLYLRTRQVDRLLYLRRYDEALEAIDDAEALAVTDDDSYAVSELRAIVYMGLRQFEDAVDEADAVESLSSNPWSVHIVRAIAYEQLGDLDQSQSYFDAAAALGADDYELNWYRDLADLL